MAHKYLHDHKSHTNIYIYICSPKHIVNAHKALRSKYPYKYIFVLMKNALSQRVHKYIYGALYGLPRHFEIPIVQETSNTYQLVDY